MRRVRFTMRIVLVLQVALMAAILIGATSELSIAAKPEPPFTFASFAGIVPTTLHLLCPTLPDAPSGGVAWPLYVTFQVDASTSRASLSFEVKVGIGTLEFTAHAPAAPLTKNGALYTGEGGTHGMHVAGWNMENTSFMISGTASVDVNVGTFALEGTARFLDGPRREVDGVEQEIKGCSLTLSVYGEPVIFE